MLGSTSLILTLTVCRAQAEEEGGELLGVRPQEVARLNPAGAPIFSLAVDGTAPEASAASAESRQQACTPFFVMSFRFVQASGCRGGGVRGAACGVREVGCVCYRSSAPAPPCTGVQEQVNLQQKMLSCESPLLGRCSAVQGQLRLIGRLHAGVLRQRGQEHRRVGASGGRRCRSAWC